MRFNEYLLMLMGIDSWMPINAYEYLSIPMNAR